MGKTKKQKQVIEDFKKSIFFNELDENIRNAKFIIDIINYYYDSLLQVHFEKLEDKTEKSENFINDFIINDSSRLLNILKDIILLSK